MRIEKLTSTNAAALAREAAEVLARGGVVLYPTDTLYGLGADASSKEAVEKVYAIKGRDAGKPVHAIVKNIETAGKYAVVTPAARRLAARFWPGALTLILEKKPSTEIAIGHENNVGFRIPGHAFCAALTSAFSKPITTTSANMSGMASQFSVDEILAQLGTNADLIELVIDADVLPPSKPSTVVDLSGGELKVLREGAISAEDIRTAV